MYNFFFTEISFVTFFGILHGFPWDRHLSKHEQFAGTKLVIKSRRPKDWLIGWSLTHTLYRMTIITCNTVTKGKKSKRQTLGPRNTTQKLEIEQHEPH